MPGCHVVDDGGYGVGGGRDGHSITDACVVRGIALLYNTLGCQHGRSAKVVSVIRGERDVLGAVGHGQELPAPGQDRGADAGGHRGVYGRTADCTWSRGEHPGSGGL